MSDDITPFRIDVPDADLEDLRERAWMKWMSTPSIRVRNWGKRLRRASEARQSYRSSQYSQSWRV